MVLVDDERVGRLRLMESGRSLGFDKLLRAPVKILQLEFASLTVTVRWVLWVL